DDRVGSLVRLNWLGWIIVLFAITVMAIYSPRNLTEEGFNIAFLAPTWGILLLVTALVSGNSLIGDRRRGFLEQVIVTPLTPREIVDGTYLAVWEHLRRLYWLPLALLVFFCITGASPIAGSLQSLVTAAMFLGTLTWYGIACSLAARSTAGAVVSAFVLPATMVFFIPMVTLSFREDHAIVLWVIIGVWLVVTGIWSWQKLNAGSAGCFLTALHLVVIALAQCWTWAGPGRREEYPMAAMHPIFMIVAPLFRHERSYQDAWIQYGAVMEICYWMGLAIN